MLRRCCIALGLVCPVLFPLLFADRQTPAASVIRADSRGTLELHGAPNEELVSAFALRNSSSTSIRPVLTWTNCSCNRATFVPALVPPNASFSMVINSKVSVPIGRVVQHYRVRAEGEDADQSLLLTAVTQRDVGKMLAVAPDRIDVRALAIETTSETATLDIEVSYESPMATGTPSTDLVFRVPGAEVEHTEVVRRSEGSEHGFSGSLRLRFRRTTAGAADWKEGYAACAGLPQFPIVFRWTGG